MKTSVACVLIDGFDQSKTGKSIWLSQRLVSYETGKYACPGGMVEDTDASNVHAIQRELLEETGINVTDLDRFKRSIVSYHNGGKSDVTQWFILQLSDSLNETPIDTEPHKHSPWTLYTLDNAKNLPLMVSTRDVLDTL
jgi:8-oxo-dGTP pyrophosphatase MutT (NUDIX family)